MFEYDDDGNIHDWDWNASITLSNCNDWGWALPEGARQPGPVIVIKPEEAQ